MAVTKNSERIMKLGRTSDFMYMGFQPPLSEKEVEELPLPAFIYGGKVNKVSYSSLELLDDGTMDIGFTEDVFIIGTESFQEYAARVAKYLGDRSLDTTVHLIGPGSVIGQANGTPARW